MTNEQRKLRAHARRLIALRDRCRSTGAALLANCDIANAKAFAKAFHAMNAALAAAEAELGLAD